LKLPAGALRFTVRAPPDEMPPPLLTRKVLESPAALRFRIADAPAAVEPVLVTTIRFWPTPPPTVNLKSEFVDKLPFSATATELCPSPMSISTRRPCPVLRLLARV